MTPDEVLRFWREAGPDRWFSPDPGFDAACRERFMAAWEAAGRGELDGWSATSDGALALVLLLDQMPRNMFRNDARTWSTDPAARAVAEAALEAGFDEGVDPALRSFFHLPFMHAEDRVAQDRSVALYERSGNENGVKWARHHRDIVARFGRFPHRNAVLGRETTPDESAFLDQDSFRG